ncbi:hypothetical protein SAMN05216588_104223 [Pseudomonas flavescens]|uniref:DUF1853 domain-containing protein n=1 Tax=Phytopseudomonas flavescens TaxID=29435 RepID=A0A1G8C0L9_9GAMM|nr:DUF1853 family protein [Pseudomonas flavescens]SDH38914.1 hypothetical protein SAMN05216588_104223 [Pseudomonas flavescens]
MKTCQHDPFEALADLPQRLQHPVARDLAWVLLSPPLLARSPCPQRHPLSASPWARQPGRLAAWLQRQDQAPQALHAWLAQRSVRRLGLYYERLWQFALQAAPGIEVLAANLPIREAGHTLGELDLLLRDDSGVHHLELAIKLYLGNTSPGAGQWIGPGSQDRLDIKLEHLASHQLPLSARPEARPALEALTGKPIQAAMWLAGYLFYPHARQRAAPAGAHPRHLRGTWLHRRDWPAFHAADAQAHWQPLPRRAWLAPARLPQTEDWSPARLQRWLDELPESADAQLLVDLRPDGSGYLREWQRLFLVADHWPTTGQPATGSGTPLNR